MHRISKEEAFDIYWSNVGEDGVIPGHDAEYDPDLGGWLFSNVNGPLVLVRDDGEVIYSIVDREGNRVISV